MQYAIYAMLTYDLVKIRIFTKFDPCVQGVYSVLRGGIC